MRLVLRVRRWSCWCVKQEARPARQAIPHTWKHNIVEFETLQQRNQTHSLAW